MASAEDSRDTLTPKFAPGFFTESSARGAPERWKEGDKVRFKNVQVEKMGGWSERAIVGATHRGVARRTHEWSSLDGESWIAYGTNSKLYLVNRDERFDITPVRRSVTLTNPFTTTIGSPIVTVVDAGHSSNEGDAVRYSGASAVGGITIDGEYLITAVIDGDTYTITHSIAATSSATGGGSVNAEYDINAGSLSQEPALGFGVCDYGEGTWGTARDPSCSGVVRKLRTWSLDNFGEDLIASPRGEAVYWWDRTAGPLSRAVLLENAPRTNQRVLVSNSGGQIVCLGAFDDASNSPDPMFIRVGAEESLTDFTVSDESTAFEERLATGSEIITGVRTRSGVFIGTDEADYIMQEDATEIFRITKLAEGDAPLSPNCMIEIDGTAYYMAPFKFMTFDGVLDELPCDVWQSVFADAATRIDREQTDKVYSWFNEKFSEIWWHYPSEAGAGENDRYVIYNKEIRCWYFGTIARTAAAAPGPSYDLPFAFEADGSLFLHETGTEDGVGAMESYIESHDIQIGDGKEKLHLSRAVPDMVRFVGTIELYMKGKEWPLDPTYVTKGPYTITTTTRTKGVRLTARQVALRWRSNTVGADWRLGNWTFYGQPDGEG